MDFFKNEVAICSSLRQRSAWLPWPGLHASGRGRPATGRPGSPVRPGAAVRRTGRGPPGPSSNPRTARPRGRRSYPSTEPAGRARRPGGVTVRKPSRAPSGGPGLPTAMSPATSRSSPRRAATRPGTSSGGTPPRPGRPATSTWTRTRAPGSSLGDGPALLEPGHPLPAGHQRRQAGHLVALDRPEVVPLGGGPRVVGRLVRLGHQLVGVVLPHHREPGGHGGAHRVGAEALGHGHHGHRRRIGGRRLDAGPDARQSVGELREGVGGPRSR